MAKREYVHRTSQAVRRGSRPLASTQRKKVRPPLFFFLLVLLLIAVIVVILILVIRGVAGRSSGEETVSGIVSSAPADPAGDLSSLPASDGTEEATPSPSPQATPAPAFVPTEQDPVGDVEKLDSMFLVGDRAFGYYHFSEAAANRYITAVSDAGKAMQGKALYSLTAPTALDILLSEDYIQRNDIVSSNQKRALEYINDSIEAMEPSVVTVPLFDALKLHNNEELYFRTDRHWTQLGAYYAYTEFCKAKGIDPVSLDSLTDKREYVGFLGSYYGSYPNAAMEEHPDTITAWVPIAANNSLFVVQQDGSPLENWPIIQDGDEYSSGMKYNVFTAGDQPYKEIINTALTDGSSCLVVSNSAGNNLIPFLACHYQTVYAVDYRLYSGSILSLAAETGATDIILLSDLPATANEEEISRIEDRF